MAEAPSAGDDLESYLVLRGGVVQSPPQLLQLVFLDSGEASTTGILVVAFFKDRYLVAVPSSLWHRKAASRKLPSGALVRPLSIEVPAVSNESEVEAELRINCRVCLGWLSSDLVDSLSFDFEEEELTYNFVATDGETVCLPSALSLVEAAKEKFGVTVDGQVDGQSGPLDSKDSRLEDLENKFNLLQASLDRLLDDQSGGSGFHSAAEDPLALQAPPGLTPNPKRKSALRKPAVAAPPAPQKDTGLEGLDAATVQKLPFKLGSREITCPAWQL